MKFIEFIKTQMRNPTPLEMIAAELADAHIEQLQAETAVEYAQSIVNYNKARILRLNSRMDSFKSEEKK
jgi:hypothetical protein